MSLQRADFAYVRRADGRRAGIVEVIRPVQPAVAGGAYVLVEAVTAVIDWQQLDHCGRPKVVYAERARFHAHVSELIDLAWSDRDDGPDEGTGAAAA